MLCITQTPRALVAIAFSSVLAAGCLFEDSNSSTEGEGLGQAPPTTDANNDPAMGGGTQGSGGGTDGPGAGGGKPPMGGGGMNGGGGMDEGGAVSPPGGGGPDNANPGGGAGLGDPVGNEVFFVGSSNVGSCGGSIEDSGTYATGQLLQQAMARYPDAVVYGCGDNQYNDGTQEEYDGCYNQTGWGQFRGRTLAVVGDHDKDLDVWRNQFRDSSGSLLDQAVEPGTTYFSYRHGDWLLIGLDSQNKPKEQLEWLDGVLQASDAPCTLAYWHHPEWGDAEEILASHAADVVLYGHVHRYERYAPADGMQRFQTATGGAKLKGADDGQPASFSTFGITNFALGSGTYRWEFVEAGTNAVLDSGSGSCNPK